MESGEGASTAPAPVATLGRPDAGPGCSSLELLSIDSGKLQVLPIGPGVQGDHEDHATRSPGGQAAVGHSLPDNTKIPNRDSGIDSPSCSVASEPFPCEEVSEASLGPTIPEMAPDSKAPQKEADNDVDRDSSEKPKPKDSPPRAHADPAKVGCPPDQGGGVLPRGYKVCSGGNHTWCQ